MTQIPYTRKLYTPTVEEVLKASTGRTPPLSDAHFYRWLVAHEEEIRADERGRIEAAVQRVRDLHARDENIPSICRECEDGVGYMGNVDWPCPTIKALDGVA